MDYIISDPHFFHFNIIKYENRPFQSSSEMDDALMSNWNKAVSFNDRVFLLGDVAFSRNLDVILKMLYSLNGKITLLFGNHDKLLVDNYEVGKYMDINKKIFIAPVIYEPKVIINKIYEKVVLCHYPIHSWNGKIHDRKHFYGHVHSRTETSLVNAYNVSAEVLNYTPQTFDYVVNK